MKEELKNIFLMGLGAMGMTSEKAMDLKDELLKKGTELYENGKVANEELKHNLQEKMKESVTVVVEKEVSKENLKETINSLTKEEKEELLNMLKEEKKEEDEK